MGRKQVGECDRCKQEFTKDLPAPGMSKIWGSVKYSTWVIRFNYVRMNTWEKAKTASEVVASNIYTEVELCSGCWDDVLSFVNRGKGNDDKS